MSFKADRYRRGSAGRCLLFLAALSLPCALPAQEFGASTPPEGRFLLRAFPKALFTAAYFSDEGKALNLETVTGLLYVELPVQVQYGLTGALAVGAILPLGWTYQEVRPEIREDPIHRFAIREVWVTVQHRWLTIPFVSSSSLQVKLPISDKEDWEDGLRIGDGQIDVYPVYFFDYRSAEHYWFARINLGYKYRFKNGDIKPFDELTFRSVLGFELWGRPKMDVFIFADLTDFRNGDYGTAGRAFYEQEGRLHTFGYGVTLEPYPLAQVYMETSGDLSGRNRYRAMRWSVGLRLPLGSGQ
ncbi:MAG TPA: hypothetical protein VLA34_12460 [Candidatus Krumholzibacterium sp.]|nr:hypothetical protein [Candidatus Krumholzibacterium sp.]